MVTSSVPSDTSSSTCTSGPALLSTGDRENVIAHRIESGGLRVNLSHDGVSRRGSHRAVILLAVR